MPLTSGARLGHYEILAPLAAGASTLTPAAVLALVGE